MLTPIKVKCTYCGDTVVRHNNTPIVRCFGCKLSKIRQQSRVELTKTNISSLLELYKNKKVPVALSELKRLWLQ